MMIEWWNLFPSKNSEYKSAGFVEISNIFFDGAHLFLEHCDFTESSTTNSRITLFAYLWILSW